jgi:threonine synthase
MMGFQASGAAPLVLGHPVKNPKTIATAIRIGNPASWQLAELARDDSKGLIASVTDREILNAYQLVSRLEGVFCEPASAAGIAGLIRLAAKRRFKRSDTVVCTLTGHGLKDPETAIDQAKPPVTVKPSAKIIARELGF